MGKTMERKKTGTANVKELMKALRHCWISFERARERSCIALLSSEERVASKPMSEMASTISRGPPMTRGS